MGPWDDPAYLKQYGSYHSLGQHKDPLAEATFIAPSTDLQFTDFIIPIQITYWYITLSDHLTSYEIFHLIILATVIHNVWQKFA